MKVNTKTNINWFPGHMSKTLREIKERLPVIDLIIEIVDARAPLSSRNPELAKVNKKRLIILSKKDLADTKVTLMWKEYFQKEGNFVIEMDLKNAFNASLIKRKCNEIMEETFKKEAKKGLKARAIRAMVVGIPNVGKSTFINKISKRKATGVANKPGYTKGLQWVKSGNIELLDTPGVLWPKFEDQLVAIKLALIGSIKEDILPKEELVSFLINYLKNNYPNELKDKYNLNDLNNVLEDICKNRNFLIKNDEYDFKRAIDTLLKDFKDGLIASVSMEKPGEISGE